MTNDIREKSDKLLNCPLSEEELTKILYAKLQEGEEARKIGKCNPYKPNTLSNMLHSYGWVREDLRIALMRSNENYEKGQNSCGQGLDSIEEKHRCLN